MTTRLSRTLAMLGCGAWLLISFQACSSETHTAKAPVAKTDIAAPPCSQQSGHPPTPPCLPCITIALPAPSVSAERTPEACSTDMDCYSRFCNRGVCGPLRTGSLNNGMECTADRYCQSGLCDRGVCTSIGGMINGNHGEPCLQGPPYEKDGKPLSPRLNQCGAYVCVDGRCRSCTSDSECLDRKGGGTCEHAPGVPGKYCGNHKPPDPTIPKKTPPP
jgi:hypothetical protein